LPERSKVETRLFGRLRRLGIVLKTQLRKEKLVKKKDSQVLFIMRKGRGGREKKRERLRHGYSLIYKIGIVFPPANLPGDQLTMQILVRYPTESKHDNRLDSLKRK
jgi:hypothetical protein